MWPGSPRHVETIIDRVVGRSWEGVLFRLRVVIALIVNTLLGDRWPSLLAIPVGMVFAGVALYLLRRR